MRPEAETTEERGFGPFVTYVVRKRPDGVIARWESRSHRKHLSGAQSRGSTWWAPQDRDWWIGVLFAVGSFLFGLGTVPAYANAVGARPDAVTYFVGSPAWWITGVNLAGSVAFGFSAVASYVIPGTTELLSVPVTNLGTFVGAVCFFAGAILLLFERTEPVQALSPTQPRLTGPAPAQS
jgi:hypothetical protein